VAVERYRYVLEFPCPQLTDSKAGDFSKPTASDVSSLAELMFSAYQGTIDYDDETQEDAKEELRTYFRNQPILDHSAIQRGSNSYIAACLVSHLGSENTPLISYIMTRRESKRTGLARSLLEAVLMHLEMAGYSRVLATITEGNVPSERLFTSCGFERVDRKTDSMKEISI
jgi:RimJ/RimL family protein N-acetyltransferase